MLKDYLPVLIQALVALGFAVGTLVVSVLLGRSARRNAMKDSAYECGMIPQGEAQPRFSVKFYLVAMLFILFDVEVVFMYPWALNYRDSLREHGPMIFWSMFSFIGIVTVGYVYALKKGVLEWKN